MDVFVCYANEALIALHCTENLTSGARPTAASRGGAPLSDHLPCATQVRSRSLARLLARSLALTLSLSLARAMVCGGQREPMHY